MAGAEGYVRGDGLAKVTGQARYTADLALPGMLHGKFLYSGHPSARILKLDATPALTVPGVVAVVTQADVPDVRYGAGIEDRTLFASEYVRFDSEIVAAVAATTPAAAAEGVRKIIVEYEVLTPVLDPEQALADDSPLVHPDWEQLRPAYEGIVRRGNDCGFANIVKGDVEAGFLEADEIVESRYVSDMAQAVPIEPRAIVAEWEGDRVTIWSSTQVPFAARSGVAAALAIPEDSVRVIVPHLGGGFGGKCGFHQEANVAALARKARRPVRVVFSRKEEFTVPDKIRHPMIMTLRSGVTRDGLITATKARVIIDTGAYSSDSPVLTEVSTMMMAGPYRTPNLLIEGHTVYTNKSVSGSVRAPTGPEACWALESHIDEIAQRVGIDPVQLRLRNLAGEGDTGPTGQVHTSIGTRECLQRAAELIGWDRPLAAGEGVGAAVGWWFSAPSAAGADVRLNADGSAHIVTGAQENGSGAVMALSLLVTEQLGVPPERVRVLYQDTDAGHWDIGSSGSQTTFNVGRAVLDAAGQVRRRVLERASEMLEAAPEDLELDAGGVHVKGAPGRRLSLAEIASESLGAGVQLAATSTPNPVPMPENFGGSSCVGRAAFPAFAAPAFFAQAARVRVDKETGVVRVLEVAAAHDFGRVLNPAGAAGQVEGGIAMGVGLALLEGQELSADGRQRNPDLLDYKLPTAADSPVMRVEFIELPHPDAGPHGAKGVGEPPVVPTPGAVANAVTRAAGVRLTRLPMTPPRVWEALRSR